MSAEKTYVLDANAFIQSKRKFYAFDICPGFWQSIVWHHTHGKICSIDRVAAELEKGGDDLWTWAKSDLPSTFFVSTDDPIVIGFYRLIIVWAQGQKQFLPEAKAEFAEAERADAWLIAHAMATGSTVVTMEEYDPNVRRRIPLPNVCKAAGIEVECVTIFEMLRRLQAKFNWQPPT
jgi:hypothetical protein